VIGVEIGLGIGLGVGLGVGLGAGLIIEFESVRDGLIIALTLSHWVMSHVIATPYSISDFILHTELENEYHMTL